MTTSPCYWDWHLIPLLPARLKGICVRNTECQGLRWTSCMCKQLDHQFPLWQCLSISSLKDDPLSLFNFWSLKVWCQLISLMTLSEFIAVSCLWNVKAGRRKVGHVSPDMLQTVWGRGTHLQYAVKWNIGRKQLSLPQSEFHQLLSTSTPYTTQNAKVPGEFPLWAWTARVLLFKEFSEAVCYLGAESCKTFFSLVTSTELQVRRVWLSLTILLSSNY